MLIYTSVGFEQDSKIAFDISVESFAHKDAQRSDVVVSVTSSVVSSAHPLRTRCEDSEDDNNETLRHLSSINVGRARGILFTCNFETSLKTGKSIK